MEPGSAMSFPHNSVMESQPVAVQLEKKRQKARLREGTGWGDEGKWLSQYSAGYTGREEDPNLITPKPA